MCFNHFWTPVELSVKAEDDISLATQAILGSRIDSLLFRIVTWIS